MVVDLDVRPVFRKRLLDPRGRASAAPATLTEVTSETDATGAPLKPVITPPLDRVDEVYEALVLGTRDYVAKNGFTDVVIGLSGGIDSSLVACIAVDALGAEHVHGVALPSRFTSGDSNDHAAQLADTLGIDFRTIPIEPAHAALLDDAGAVVRRPARGPHRGEPPGSRSAASCSWPVQQVPSWLVLTTGNKSEMAVGYTTLYGRHGGRLRGHQGRVQDRWCTRWPACATSGRAPISSPRRC